MRQRPRVASLGWFGHGNTGDDLIMLLIRRFLRPSSIWSTVERRTYRTLLQHVDGLPERAGEVDLVVVGGGGLLYKRYIDMLHLEGFPRPYGFLSVGIPHLDWLEGLDKVVEQAAFVTLRDHRAVGMFRAAFPHVPCAFLPDPAFLLAIDRWRRWSTRAPHRGRKPTIVVNVRYIPKHWLRPTDPPESIEDQIAVVNAIIERHRDRARFIAVGFDRNDERVLPSVACDYVIADPFRAVRLIRHADGVLATRLHCAIIAATQGTPFVMVDYQDKVRGLAELLGMERQCFPFQDLSGLEPFVAERIEDPVSRLDTRIQRAFAGEVETFLGTLASRGAPG